MTIDALVLDWLNIGLRWVHLIAGIGWIGTSLYFMWLDAALIRADPPRGNVEGHTWLLHSGGFFWSSGARSRRASFRRRSTGSSGKPR